MNITHLMIRFGELSTKGKNKKDFIKQLAKNIKHVLKDYPTIEYNILYDHIYVVLNGNNPDTIISILKNVSGIHAISPVVKLLDDDIENIKKVSLEMVKDQPGKTFKVKAKRANKAYPIISDKIIRMVASLILEKTNLTVDVHNPDILLSIEIRDEGTYIFLNTILCSGGYPLGSGGKILMMLSGGIDSPVAGYLLIKRGIRIECIHYASPPYTQLGVIEKLKDILQVLSKYQANIALYIVPFTKLQEKIYEVSDESYAITIMRRMMYRIAEKLAIIKKCQAIANGESIGQVASQTLESINVINRVCTLPVIRPLATFDKLDIIDIAKKIGTYDISIRPYEDCCTIFAPKKPKTKPSLKEVEFFESKFDYNSYIDDCVKNIETIIIKDE